MKINFLPTISILKLIKHDVNIKINVILSTRVALYYVIPNID